MVRNLGFAPRGTEGEERDYPLCQKGCWRPRLNIESLTMGHSRRIVASSRPCRLHSGSPSAFQAINYQPWSITAGSRFVALSIGEPVSCPPGDRVPVFVLGRMPMMWYGGA